MYLTFTFVYNNINIIVYFRRNEEQYEDIEQNPSITNNIDIGGEHNSVIYNSLESEEDHEEPTVADENQDDNSSSESEEDNENSSSENEEDYEEIIAGEEYQGNNEPLYCAPLTVDESMLFILTIFMKYNITLLCIADIIEVINLHCLNIGLTKNNLYKFQKYFSFHISVEVIKHYYCATCTRKLRNAESICPSCQRRKNSYFVELPFLEQLKEMYKEMDFMMIYNIVSNVQSINKII